MTVTKDFLAGLMFVIIGMGAVLIARNYQWGTAGEFGPADFPVILGGLITILGGVLLFNGLSNKDDHPGERWAARPFVILIGVMAFAVLIVSAGLLPAIIVLVFIGRLADRGFRFVETLIMSAVLSVLSIALFVYGLNIPLRLMPWP